jgi:prophage regulatory protein
MNARYFRMADLGTTPKSEGRLPLHPNSIYRLVREGKFPKPIRLSENCIAWRVSDIEDWEKARESESLADTTIRRMKASRGEVAEA